MFKYIKTAFFIIFYAFVYMAVMLLCQSIFGLTLGGAGVPVMNLLDRGSPVDADRLSAAVDEMARLLDSYVLKNTGVIFSISALISLLLFIQIFRARKIDLFSVIHMKGKPSGADMLYGAFAGASTNFVISLILVGIQSLGFFKEAFSDYNAHMNQAFGSGNVLPLLLGVGIIVPAVEEIMFRGMISNELARIMPLKTALIVQGVLFGLYHLVPLQICYTIPLGIYFGFIGYKSDSIWPAVSGHVAMNSIAVFLATPFIESAFIRYPETAFLFMTVSVVMFVCALAYFIRKKAHS